MKRFSFLIVAFLVVALPGNVYAKRTPNIWKAFEYNYAPASGSKGLNTAAADLDLKTIKTYVVVMKGGIPAERAAFWISWAEYDYRGVTIDNDSIDTRRGEVYTYLQTADVMAVAGLDQRGSALYMKLISPEIYIPENKKSEKRHSRVTNEVGIKLPNQIYRYDDARGAMSYIADWFRPFSTLETAKRFSREMR